MSVRDLDVVRQLRRNHERVDVALLDDAEIERLYGRAPLMSLPERTLIVASLAQVAEVGVFSGYANLPEEAYAIAGEPMPPGGQLAEIAPGRETASSALRAALRPIAPAALRVAVA